MTGAGTYNNLFRNMLLTSDEIPIVYIAYFITPAASTGYQILSFPIEPIQATATWSQQAMENTATNLPYGLIFGETENVLYTIGMQAT